MEEKLTKDERKALRQETDKEKALREQKNRLYKTIALWSFGGLLLVLALWALVAFSSGTTTSTNSSITVPPVTASDFQQGPTSSTSGKVATLVEYADFQCPACKAYYPLLKQLQADFPTNLHFVYRFFPLKTIHQNAINSAKAAYAAGKQGKFWEMHDKLFETQDTWATLADPENTFVGYAKDLGLTPDAFKKDYESQESLTFVNDAYTKDTAMGLNGTPTFFLNGKQINNPQGYQEFKTIIQQAVQ